MATRPQLEPEALPTLAQGYRMAQALYVLAAIGVPDLLEDGPRTSAELAEMTAVHPDRLGRVLRALAGKGALLEDEQRRFHQTAFSAQLCGDSEARLMLLGWRCLPERYQAFAGLLHAVRTGEPAFDHAHGSAFYERLGRNTGATAAYERAMESTAGSFRGLLRRL